MFKNLNSLLTTVQFPRSATVLAARGTSGVNCRRDAGVTKGTTRLLLLLCLVSACDRNHDENEKSVPAPMNTPNSDPKSLIGEEVDLIADKPVAGTELTPVKTPLLEDFSIQGPLGESARKCYGLVADMKKNIDAIGTDLDAGGKEITRLVRASDQLSKYITELAGLWPHNEDFFDLCRSAKSRALLLNEELARVPRKWTHVRWSFNAMLQDVRKLRLSARDLAEAEPKPIPVTGKDGKIVYVEQAAAPVDPQIAKREEKAREVEEAKKRFMRAEEAKKEKPMRKDLD